jgi:hypothetical protein
MRSLIFLLELACIVAAGYLCLQLVVSDQAFLSTLSVLALSGAVAFLLAGAWCLHQVLMVLIGYPSHGDDYYGSDQ